MTLDGRRSMRAKAVVPETNQSKSWPVLKSMTFMTTPACWPSSVALAGGSFQEVWFDDVTVDGKPFTSEDVRFTTKDGAVYATVMGPPQGVATVKSLGTGAELLEQRIIEAMLLRERRARHVHVPIERLEIAEAASEVPGELVDGAAAPTEREPPHRGGAVQADVALLDLVLSLRS